MKISRTIVPTLALASLTLAGCSTVESGGSSSSAATVPSNPMSSSPAAAQTQATSAAPETSSAAESSPESSPAASETSSSASTDSSSSPSSQAASSAKVTKSDIIGFASSHETRSCLSKNLAYVSSAQFCKEDASSIDASYKGQRVYFTTAVQFKSSAKYSYEISNGSQSKKGTLDSKGTSNADGQAVTLTVKVPMEQSGTYSIKFLENGSQFASDSVNVTVK